MEMKHPMLMGSLIAGVIGCILGLVGLATTGWLTLESLGIGLFSVCTDSACASYTATDSVAAAKAFVVIGWLCSVSALITAIIYFFKFAKNDVANRNIPLISAVFFFIAGAASLLGAIIFAASGKGEIEDQLGSVFDLGYSFALTIIAAILFLASGGLMFVHRGRIGGA